MYDISQDNYVEKYTAPVVSPHYSEVLWVLWCLKFPATEMFGQLLVNPDTKENIKSPYYCMSLPEENLTMNNKSPHKGPVI